METVYKLYNYMGNKGVHLDTINKIIFKMKLDETYDYFGPFLGSGIVAMNLKKKFKSYNLNDLQYDLTLCFRNADKITSDKIKQAIAIEKPFRIGKFKEGYYEFRDEVYNKETDDVMKSIYLFMIGNCCINSMVRFGPNGFNQSFGFREYIEKINEFKAALNVINKMKPKVHSEDFKVFLDRFTDKTFMFLDPPYYLKPMSCEWDVENTEYLIDFLIKHKEIRFIYTDIAEGNVYAQKLINSGCLYQTDTKIRNSSPNRTEETKNKEIFVYR